MPITIAILILCAQHPSSRWMADLLGSPDASPELDKTSRSGGDRRNLLTWNLDTLRIQQAELLLRARCKHVNIEACGPCVVPASACADRRGAGDRPDEDNRGLCLSDVECALFPERANFHNSRLAGSAVHRSAGDIRRCGEVHDGSGREDCQANACQLPPMPERLSRRWHGLS